MDQDPQAFPPSGRRNSCYNGGSREKGDEMRGEADATKRELPVTLEISHERRVEKEQRTMKKRLGDVF